MRVKKNSFAVDHSLMTPKSTHMNLLAVAVCLKWGGKLNKKREGRVVPQRVLMNHELSPQLSTSIMGSYSLSDRWVVLSLTLKKGPGGFRSHFLKSGEEKQQLLGSVRQILMTSNS